MRKLLKNLWAVFLSTGLLLFFFEVIFRFIGAPGTSFFLEKVIIKEGLRPRKAPGEIRIFAFGESSLHGAHYFPVSSPSRWLQAYLKDFLPDKKIRVVNFARMGSGANFAYRAFRGTLFYQPDIAIFYVGHNAFLHRSRRKEVETEESSFNFHCRMFILKSYFIATVSRWFLKARMEARGGRSDDQIEFKVIETPPLGIGLENSMPRNGPYYWDNIDFFKENVAEILRLAREKQIPVLFLKPVSNLKDFAPFHSVHMKTLTAGELAKWEKSYGEGKQKQIQGNLTEALNFYLQAYQLDPTYADLSFRLGQIYFRKGDLARAKQLFEEARDNDAIVFRATKDILSYLEELEKSENLQLVDTEKVLAAEAPGGIMGEPIIEDNAHFSLKGHSLVGRLVAEELAARNWIAPRSEWRFERERPYEEIARDLGIDQDVMFTAALKMVNYFGSRFDNRVRFAKKALEIYPDDPRALRYLAWTYWLMGRKREALATYRKLAKVDRQALDEVFKAQPSIRDAFEKSAVVPAITAKAAVQAA